MNCKSIVFCCLAIWTLNACGSKYSSLRIYIENADSVSVAFYNKDEDATQIVIRDKASVAKLSEYIDGKTIAPFKCTDTGSIWFYEGGKKKMQVDFSTHPGCSFFSYMMNDKIYTKIMTDDATRYLNSVEEIATDTL